ncbi:hypothetical protein N7U49_43675 [Streptomyces sp. AD2-2]|nr:hypothetical protein N7U49_43675 [Streptomyces sp. AD2-2]
MVALAPYAPRITMETSATETPARAATWASVGRFPSGTAGVVGTVVLPVEVSFRSGW